MSLACSSNSWEAHIAEPGERGIEKIEVRSKRSFKAFDLC
jgi:hypothetical protein